MIPDGQSVPEPAIAVVPAAVADTLAGPRSRAEPDDVREWFDLETIVNLPAPAASFAEAEVAAAD